MLDNEAVLSVRMKFESHGAAKCEMIMPWNTMLDKYKKHLSVEVIERLFKGEMYKLNFPNNCVISSITFNSNL